ncbi:hypothetical protein C0995_012645 [Termitomyces sp. Mi166|nr:hypothetical protein C0995_012645 [Termitomyces sp. Mi166\
MAGTGNSTPQAGDAGVIPVPQAGETPEASVYRLLHNWEESDTQNVSVSVGILPSLVYLDPSNFIGQQQSSVESLPQQQGGAYAHSTPLRPIQVMSPRTERVGDYQSVMHPTQYQAIRCQRVPVIVEAMDALNAPRQAEESQQDFESGVPLRAVSDVKTTTSKIVDEEEFEILQLPQIPGQHVTIKEEALERIVPADAENLQVIARRIPLVDR